MRLCLTLLLLLAACGGGGETPTKSVPFGWWNGFGTSGSLSIAEPREYGSAIASGKQAIVIVWPTIWDGKALLPGWKEALRQLIADTPNASGYYLFDEPGIHGMSDADLDAVAAELPPHKIVMLSVSAPELDRAQYVPRAVNLLGVNLYSSHGQTPATAVAYLGKLAGYGKPMYINLDAARFPAPPGGCAAISEAEQRLSIAVNDAMIGWGRGRDIRAYVAFLWQSALQSPERVCGAEDLPLIRAYMAPLAGVV